MTYPSYFGPPEPEQKKDTAGSTAEPKGVFKYPENIRDVAEREIIQLGAKDVLSFEELKSLQFWKEIAEARV